MKILLLSAFTALMMTLTPAAQAAVNPACEGRFVNPISDICWDCMFPMSIGSAQVSASSLPDTENPASPIQFCPVPPPIFERIGLAIGFWEPFALTDVTRAPYCMVNLGGTSINAGQIGNGGGKRQGGTSTGAFYHVHWYKYPLTWWLNIITDLGCLQGGDMDIGYLSELDPTWDDSSLASVLSPEAFVFANPVAQAACVADALASAVSRPLNPLFWCAGSHGSLYPFSGFVSNQASPQAASVLLSERMDYKLHRQGMILDSVGADTAVCYEYPTPIMPKDRYRYQMVNMYPDATQCHPFGRTVMKWQAGHASPASRHNFGYLIWRKRNCVYL